jgi:hypothetical protein
VDAVKRNRPNTPFGQRGVFFVGIVAAARVIELALTSRCFVLLLSHFDLLLFIAGVCPLP